MRSDGNGFTLVEILVAVTIFAIIGVGLYSALATGIITWRKGEVGSTIYQEARLALGRISVELRNSIRYNDEKFNVFEGGVDSIKFATVLNTADPGEEDKEFEVCEVSYYLDESPTSKIKSLFRRVETIPESFEETRRDGEEVASFVEAIKFSYIYRQGEGPPYEYEWKDEWVQPEGEEEEEEDGKIPRAVKIELTLKDESSNKEIPFAKIITIPTGEFGEEGTE